MEPSLEILSATGVPVRLRLCGAGARAYGFVVDFLIRIIASGGWAAAWLLIAGRPDPEDLRRWAIQTLVTYLLPFAFFVLYHPILELAMGGRTPGKRLAGTRLVDERGQAPGAMAILIRNVFRLIDSLPFAYGVGLITCLVTARCVRFGDMAAGTLLVYAQAPVDAADFDDRAIGASTNDRAQLARELLARWGELGPAVRRSLATRLLAEPASDIDDDLLRDRLAALQNEGR